MEEVLSDLRKELSFLKSRVCEIEQQIEHYELQEQFIRRRSVDFAVRRHEQERNSGLATVNPQVLPDSVPMAATRVVMHEIIVPAATDTMGICFGGQVLSWIDVCAGLSAKTLARGPCVTASVDAVHFLRPCKVGMVVIIAAQVNRTFKSSMEVGVRVEAEDMRSGARYHCCSAFLTFVSIGTKPAAAGSGQGPGTAAPAATATSAPALIPAAPPDLKAASPSLPRVQPHVVEEEAEWQAAEQRRQQRLRARQRLRDNPQLQIQQDMCRLTPITHREGGSYLPPAITLDVELTATYHSVKLALRQSQSRTASPRNAQSPRQSVSSSQGTQQAQHPHGHSHGVAAGQGHTAHSHVQHGSSSLPHTPQNTPVHHHNLPPVRHHHNITSAHHVPPLHTTAHHHNYTTAQHAFYGTSSNAAGPGPGPSHSYALQHASNPRRWSGDAGGSSTAHCDQALSHLPPAVPPLCGTGPAVAAAVAGSSGESSQLETVAAAGAGSSGLCAPFTFESGSGKTSPPPGTHNHEGWTSSTSKTLHPSASTRLFSQLLEGAAANVAARSSWEGGGQGDLGPLPPRRRISPELTNAFMTQSIMPQHANTLGITFGGQVMSWIESCAYISASRLRAAPHLLTASVDSLAFTAPTRVGNILYLTSQVTAIFGSSLEVMVCVHGEDPAEGRVFHCADAYVTVVGVDMHSEPVMLPFEIEPHSCSEQLRYQAAIARRAERLGMRAAIIAAQDDKDRDSRRSSSPGAASPRHSSMATGSAGRAEVGAVVSSESAGRSESAGVFESEARSESAERLEPRGRSESAGVEGDAESAVMAAVESAWQVLPGGDVGPGGRAFEGGNAERDNRGTDVGLV